MDSAEIFYIVIVKVLWMTDVVEVLCSRREYVEAIEDGCRGKRELAQELDVSESMVYKAIRELRGHGIVDDHDYSLTVTGRLLLENYRKMQRISDASELWERLDVPTEVLEDARPVLPKRHAPQRPIDKLETEIDRASKIRGLAPTILHRYVSATDEMIRENDLDAEFVVEQDVLRELAENYGELFHSSLEHGMEVLVTEEELPFGHAVLDGDRSCIVVYDDRGRVEGALFFRSPEAVAWTEEIYERYRCDARHFEGVEI